MIDELISQKIEGAERLSYVLFPRVFVEVVWCFYVSVTSLETKAVINELIIQRSEGAGRSCNVSQGDCQSSVKIYYNNNNNNKFLRYPESSKL